jgi:4-amino-4-deoxy-L-arabinose transferase
MENLIPGIITVVLCLAGYFQSWRYQAKDNYHLAVWLLLIAGLLLRIYTSTDFFLHYWDERYHALVAKNLINHPFRPTLYDTPLLPYDYFNWPGNHIWLHKQPMALWLMAGSMKLFGINEIALRLPSILMSTAGIWMMWFTGKYFAGKKADTCGIFLFGKRT